MSSKFFLMLMNDITVDDILEANSGARDGSVFS